MRTREVKVVIKVSVAKELVDNSDEPYLYKLGYEKEDEAKQSVEKGVEAWFDGFELFDHYDAGEEMVNAKLHYTVLVEM